jgi:hypothetical protein
MRPNASRLAALIVATLIVIAFLCQFFRPGPALAAGNSARPTVRLHGFRGASPKKALMPPSKSVLRLVVSRKPVACCLYPERKDALNFLSAYVVETLECGHQVEQFFNPPVEALIAKRRRCGECNEAGNVIEIAAGKKKPPVSVEIPAAGRRRTSLLL